MTTTQCIEYNVPFVAKLLFAFLHFNKTDLNSTKSNDQLLFEERISGRFWLQLYILL